MVLWLQPVKAKRIGNFILALNPEIVNNKFHILMKKYLATILASSTIVLATACHTTPTVESVQTTVVSTDAKIQLAISLLPAKLKADVALAVSKVASPKNLNTVANAIESLAKAGAALPPPAYFQNGVLPWVEQLPDVGPIAEELFAAYSEAYPLLQPTSETLVALGEFVRQL